jgi:hypothetical protein
MFTFPAEYDQFKEELIVSYYTVSTDYIQFEWEMICETLGALLTAHLMCESNGSFRETVMTYFNGRFHEKLPKNFNLDSC